MNKIGNDFLAEIEERILHLPNVEIKKAISYYRESYEDKLEDGMSDEAIIKSFGPIDKIVESIEEEVTLTSIVRYRYMEKKDRNRLSKISIILLIFLTSPLWITIISILFAAFVTIYSMFLVIPITIVITLFCFFLTAAISIIFGIIKIFSFSFLIGFYLLGIGLILAGISIAFYNPVLYIVKFIISLHVKMLKKIKHTIIRR